MKWKKINEKKFLISIPKTQNNFIVNTLPFQIFSVSKNITKINIETTKCLKNNKEGIFKNYFALDLIVTTHCNLQCSYCCARTSEKQELYGLATRHMDKKTAEKIIILVCELFKRELDKDPGNKFARFDLFITGGEPLLNFFTLEFIFKEFTDIFEKISKETGKKILFSPEIATNATLINDKIAQILKKYDVQCAITIDGPWHKKTRTYKNGKDSLLETLKGLETLYKYSNKVKVQTVSPIGNDSYITKVFEYYKKIKIFDITKRIHVIPQSAPLLALYEDRNKKIMSKKEKINIAKHARILIRISKEFGLDLKNYQERLFRSILAGGFKYRCPAGQWKISVTPDGNIYPCHQFTNIKEFCMGNINQDNKNLFKNLETVKNKFYKRTVFKVKPCKDCLFQTICIPFVDCPARCFLESKDFYKVPQHYCKIHRPYMEKLLENYILNKNNPNRPQY